jgi:hypothetical protein
MQADGDRVVLQDQPADGGERISGVRQGHGDSAETLAESTRWTIMQLPSVAEPAVPGATRRMFVRDAEAGTANRSERGSVSFTASEIMIPGGGTGRCQ